MGPKTETVQKEETNKKESQYYFKEELDEDNLNNDELKNYIKSLEDFYL